MHKKKILILIVLTVCALAAFVGCAQNSQEGATDAIVRTDLLIPDDAEGGDDIVSGKDDEILLRETKKSLKEEKVRLEEEIQTLQDNIEILKALKTSYESETPPNEEEAAFYGTLIAQAEADLSSARKSLNSTEKYLAEIDIDPEADPDTAAPEGLTEKPEPAPSPLEEEEATPLAEELPEETSETGGE